MLFVRIKDGREEILVPASEIETVIIYADREDQIRFSDGSSGRVGNFYGSLVEIKGKEIESL